MAETSVRPDDDEVMATRVEAQAEALPLTRMDYPLVPLKNTVIFPGAKVTLNIGREKSIQAIHHADTHGRHFIAVAQREENVDQPGQDDVFEVGTLVTIQQAQAAEAANKGALEVIVEGVERVRIEEWLTTQPFITVRAVSLPEPSATNAQAAALVRHAQNLFRDFARHNQNNRRFLPEEMAAISKLRGAGRLADTLAVHVLTDAMQQQDILETLDPAERLEKLCVTLGNENEILELEDSIRNKVRQQVDKNQREYYLKEQMRAIQEELGSDSASEIAELRERVARKGMPDEARVKLVKEVDRLERMPANSAEIGVLRNYIDWMLALPWQERSDDRLDMKYAKRVLDEDHYGLDKVKERIIEFLAVRQLRLLRAQRAAQRDAERAASDEKVGEKTGEKTAATTSAKAGEKAGEKTDEKARAQASNANKGPILCLVGPPGVGKTSLGRSVAQALGRKFVRISLGGVHDEAEIRGHRRTYVGALPGRIIQAMKTVGVSNPVFLLDEVDKITSDYRGDPSAALLEVLDPEQNNTFTDHYLEVPYDLSEVFFICTANNRYQIPRPLADRMDIVQIPGYTEDEKVIIGRTHVLPKVLSENSLERGQAQVSEGVMRFIVTRYTREAGIRNLERQLNAICRKVALRVVEHPDRRVRVTEKLVEQFLGVPRYTPERAQERGQVGVATGLAWTENGGTLLPVEVVTMPGKGSFQVTGQLGDVMQESARAALSYIRSRAATLDLPEEFPDGLDIHIHLPEGAIPKDGPSAGITMALAIVSALTRRPIRNDLAMTGEITLRGRVLAIGGLKEKTLAAHSAGIRHLIVPKENEKDLAEIPARARAEMRFTTVESMDEVLAVALLDAEPAETEPETEGEPLEQETRVAASRDQGNLGEQGDQGAREEYREELVERPQSEPLPPPSAPEGSAEAPASH